MGLLMLGVRFSDAQRNRMLENNSGPIWTRTFILLCLAQFLAYGHHALLTPTLPLYLTGLGSSPFLIGLMLAVFSGCSVLVRPVIGCWADSWSETGVLTLGCALLGVSVLLFLIPDIGGAFLANGLRGVAWAGVNTAGYSLLAYLVPHGRRGEAAGFYSGIQSSTTIFFPAVGLWIMDLPYGGFAAVFFASAAMALIGSGLGVSCGHRESKDGPALGGKPSRPGARAFVDRGVLFAAVLLLCLNLPHAAVTSFLVLYTRDVGIENLGWYFVASGSTSLMARPLLGRVSDRIGRGRAVAAGYVLEMTGILFVMAASGLGFIVMAGILYFLGSAMGVATTLALAMERADPQRRGVAMATFSMAFPLGTGLGAVVAGGLIGIVGYSGMYVAEVVLLAAGLLLVLARWSNLNAS